MIWEKQFKKEYCVLSNRKLCKNSDLCCTFCHKKDCVWRCKDDCVKCKFITDEIAHLGTAISMKPVKNTFINDIPNSGECEQLLGQIKKYRNIKHKTKCKRKLI